MFLNESAANSSAHLVVFKRAIPRHDSSMAATAQVSWTQIRTLTSASIRSRYRNTWAGLLWVILSPVLMFSAQSYAFKTIMKIHFENYPLFLLIGLLPWIFMTQSLSMCTTLFASQARMLKSFPIHPLVLLLSVLIDNFVNFSISFVLILGALLVFMNGALPHNLWLLPIPLLSVFMATCGLTWIFATSQVFFYDLKFILDFVMSVAFFLTPIAYPVQFVGPEHMWIVDVNPFAILLAPIQALSGEILPDNYGFLLARSFLLAISLLAMAALYWRSRRNMIYFRL
ncbi:MAG TPA: ABC transporter permease [Bdellovibrionales bacterium]|jgi:ABC-type polysaccharide/polyol phosphate export permease|nr:ABC transporter permease [Bdellovibrionales bacterium]